MPEPAGLAALISALGATQKLLSRPAGRRRWKNLAGIAIAAGIVGAGVQPPPLGLLQPLWGDPHARRDFLRALSPHLGMLYLLGGLLLPSAALARVFSFVFIQAASGAEPGSWRRSLGMGLRHFAWSGLFTIPLYLMLFAAEWQVTREGWQQLLKVPDVQVNAVLLGAAGRFLLVLVPWMFLTLPAMVAMYELTPVAMLEGGIGPVKSFGRVVAAAGQRPRVFAGYFALRLALQILGTSAAMVALVPSAALGALIGAPVLLPGWALWRSFGGWGVPAGAQAGAITVLLYLAILYCVMCTVLVPVSALLYIFASNFLASQQSAVEPLAL